LSTGFIYLITNTVNNKKYVGKTVVTVDARWTQHKSDAKANRGHLLHRAIRKHGPDAFTIEVLAKADEEQLAQLEKDFIVSLRTHSIHGSGYNLTAGGEGVPGGELHHLHKSNPRSAAAREKIGNCFRGKVLSPEHIANRTAAQKDKPRSAAWLASVEAYNVRTGRSKKHRHKVVTEGDVQGVTWIPQEKMWRAALRHNGVDVRICQVRTQKEAVERLVAYKLLHGILPAKAGAVGCKTLPSGAVTYVARITIDGKRVTVGQSQDKSEADKMLAHYQERGEKLVIVRPRGSVTWCPSADRWKASLTIDYVEHYVGKGKTEDEARQKLNDYKSRLNIL
jgi:group I intron endonuclease